MADSKGAFAAMAAIIGAAILLHLPVLFFGEVYAPSGDILYQNYPWRDFYASELKQGKLALWYPHQACGFPLFAEGQTGMLYPPNLILHYFFDTWTAISLFCLLHSILAGAGAFLLIRRLGAGEPAAAILSAVYMGSGPMTAHLGHFNLIAVAALMPWLLDAGLKAAQAFSNNEGYGTFGIRLRSILAVALTALLMILAGHQQMTAISVIALFLLLAAKLVVVRQEERPRAIHYLLAPFAGVIAGAILALPQLLSTFQLLRLSNRADFSLADFFSYSYPPTMLATLTHPFAFGAANAWKSPGYHGPQGFVEFVSFVGPLPLALAIAGFIGILARKESKWSLSVRHAYKCALAAYSAGVVALVLAMGKYAGVYAILWLVPGMSATRIPARFIIPAILLLCALAAIALDGVLLARLGDAARRAAIVAIFLVCFLPLLSFHKAFNLTSLKGSATPVPEQFKKMAAESGVKRIFYTGEPAEGLLDVDFGKPCYPAIAGLGSVGWAGELVLKDYKAFFEAALAGDRSPVARARASETAAWLGAIPTSDLNGASEPQSGLYVIGNIRNLASDSEIIEHFYESYPLFLDQLVYVAGENGISASGKTGDAAISAYSHRSQTYKVESTGGALFVRTVVHYPGWAAYVNGEPARIIKANGAFQAVEVGEGISEVVFNYEEGYERKVILWFSIVAAVILASLITPLVAVRPGGRT